MADLLLYAAVLAGVAAAGYLVARSPAFWFGLVTLIWTRAWPIVWAYVSKSSLETQARAKSDSNRDTERTASGKEREH